MTSNIKNSVMTAIPRHSRVLLSGISVRNTQNKISDLNTFGDDIKYKKLGDGEVRRTLTHNFFSKLKKIKPHLPLNTT